MTAHWCLSVLLLLSDVLAISSLSSREAVGSTGRPADFLFEQLLTAITWCPGENEFVLNGENENQQDSES